MTPPPRKATRSPQQKKRAATKKAASATANRVAQEYFGQQVRELREKAGMSQTDLAKLLCIEQSRMPEIERGERDVRISTVRRFAVALGVSPKDLISGN